MRTTPYLNPRRPYDVRAAIFNGPERLDRRSTRPLYLGPVLPMKRTGEALPENGCSSRRCIGALGAAFQAASALAGPGMIVGADEDSLVWGNSQQTASNARALGLKAIRITRQWHPGESKVPSDFQDTLYRLVGDVSGLRVVVSALRSRPRTRRAPTKRAASTAASSPTCSRTTRRSTTS